MKKEFSPELNILIQAIKNQFDQQGNVRVIPDNNYNINRLAHMYRYHGIQALLYSFEQNEPFMNDSIRKDLTQYISHQVRKNLQYAAETTRLLTLFSSYQVPLSVLKGNILISSVYQNKQVRTTSDLDVLIEKKYLKKGLEILLKDGFRISSPNLIHLDSIPVDLEDLILNQNLHNEIHLQKGTINLDFHWDLFQHYFYQKYQEKQPLKDRVFNLTEKIKFYGIETSQLNPEGLFWSLLAHHGGKESWFRLRHIQDFHALMYQFEKKIAWEDVIKSVDDYRLTTAFKNGLFILKTYLNYSLPPILDHYIHDINLSRIDLIVKEWEKSIYWGSNRALMIRNLYMTTLFQDKDFSYLKHIQIYFNYFTKLKQIEHYPNSYSFIELSKSSFQLLKRLIKKE